MIAIDSKRERFLRIKIKLRRKQRKDRKVKKNTRLRNVIIANSERENEEKKIKLKG